MSEERKFRREAEEKFPSTIYAIDAFEVEGDTSILGRAAFGTSVEEAMNAADNEEGPNGVRVAVYELKKLLRARTTIAVTEEKNGGNKERRKGTKGSQERTEA